MNGTGLGGIFVTGDDGDGGRIGPVRERNARVGRTGNGTGNAGNFLKGNARVHEFLGLFAAASENVGIAALEARNNLALLRLGDEQLVDVALFHGVIAGDFAYIDEFGIGPGQGEELLAGKIVVHHDVRFRKNLSAFAGEQAGIAGACADEINVHPSSGS